MTYRFLRAEEFVRVQPVFREANCEIPASAEIWVGEEDGEIVSLQCKHMVCHLGPVWVRPDQRGKGLWKRMQEALEKTLPSGFGFYQFGTASNESQFQRLKLEPLHWTVWMKRVA
jgi:hypothetical protein